MPCFMTTFPFVIDEPLGYSFILPILHWLQAPSCDQNIAGTTWPHDAHP